MQSSTGRGNPQVAVLELDTLAPIKEKVVAGERLDFDDGVALMETDDLLALGDLADLARRQRGGGDEVYFVQNINLYQTNVCRVKCKFCAFAKTQKQEDAFTLTADEFVADAVAQYEVSTFSASCALPCRTCISSSTRLPRSTTSPSSPACHTRRCCAS